MIQELFFRLVRSALWKAPVELEQPVSAETWQEVYAMAKRQTVEGVLFDVIRDLSSDSGMPLALAARWMLDADNIEKWYRRMSAELEVQTRFWQENGIDAVLMKGMSVAVMYPVPEHRVFGDIDWWMRGEHDWDRALELVRDKGFDISYDSDGDIHYVSNDIVVEHHRYGLPVEGPVGVLLMLNEHILHHAMVAGIGVRHMCDMAMAYRHYSGAYDAAEYVSKLREMRMLRWTALLHGVLKTALGTPSDLLPDVPVTLRVPQRDCDRLVRLVMEDGNFGLDKKNRYSGFRRRFMLLFRYVPGLFVRRWVGLLFGRMRRQ